MKRNTLRGAAIRLPGVKVSTTLSWETYCAQQWAQHNQPKKVYQKWAKRIGLRGTTQLNSEELALAVELGTKLRRHIQNGTLMEGIGCWRPATRKGRKGYAQKIKLGEVFPDQPLLGFLPKAGSAFIEIFEERRFTAASEAQYDEVSQ